jgi:hypothetical protein
MTTEELYITIQNIEHRKSESGIVPTHALRIADIFKELKKYSTDEIDGVLRELLDAGRIEAGQTINDTWIKTK